MIICKNNREFQIEKGELEHGKILSGIDLAKEPEEFLLFMPP